MADLTWGMTKTAASIAALAITGALLAAPAAAVSFSVDASSPSSDTDTLSFDQFNPTLGTLTGVTFRLTDSVTTSTLEISVTGGEGALGVASGNTAFSIVGPGATTLFAGNGSAQSSCFSPGPTCDGITTSSTEPTFASANSLLTPGDNLTPFIGTGQFSVDVTSSATAASFTFCIQSGNGQPATCSDTTGAAWTGELNVEYRFEAAVIDIDDVPAPAALGLFAIGLAGLGFARRRTR